SRKAESYGVLARTLFVTRCSPHLTPPTSKLHIDGLRRKVVGAVTDLAVGVVAPAFHRVIGHFGAEVTCHAGSPHSYRRAETEHRAGNRAIVTYAVAERDSGTPAAHHSTRAPRARAVAARLNLRHVSRQSRDERRNETRGHRAVAN